MNAADADNFLRKVSYNKPPWKNVKFCFEAPLYGDRWGIILTAEAPSVVHKGEAQSFQCRIHPPIWPGSEVNKETLLYACLMAVLWMEEHEAFEVLSYDGKPVYEAHVDGEAFTLWALQKALMHANVSGKGPQLRIEL